MSTKMEENAKLRLVLATPDEKPMFAPEFVKAVIDAAHETLHSYLELTGAPQEAIVLLDDLVLTFGWNGPEDGKLISYIENQSMIEAMGAMSYNIPALGGKLSFIEQ